MVPFNKKGKLCWWKKKKRKIFERKLYWPVEIWKLAPNCKREPKLPFPPKKGKKVNNSLKNILRKTASKKERFPLSFFFLPSFLPSFYSFFLSSFLLSFLLAGEFLSEKLRASTHILSRRSLQWARICGERIRNKPVFVCLYLNFPPFFVLSFCIFSFFFCCCCCK